MHCGGTSYQLILQRHSHLNSSFHVTCSTSQSEDGDYHSNETQAPQAINLSVVHPKAPMYFEHTTATFVITFNFRYIQGLN